MRVAILSRPGDCFPNIISSGLSDMLKSLSIENKIFYDAIPFLMRLLPMSEKPNHWSNNFQFRVRNKINYYLRDKRFLNELKKYDVIIISECLPNAFWKNFLAVETLRKKLAGIPVLSYTDAYINNAPIHKKKWLDNNDFGAERYDKNLFPSSVTETKLNVDTNGVAIGINIALSGLKPVKKKEFIAVVDFKQTGYESFRDQQINCLKLLGIKTIFLEGRYPINQIREIYQQAAIFFLAFPETFGLPIAECLASGAVIFTPDSSWPMSWRLNEDPQPWGPGSFPECFTIYNGDNDLMQKIALLKSEYDLEKTPFKIFEIFIKHYPHFYYGNKKAVKDLFETFAH